MSVSIAGKVFKVRGSKGKVME